MKFGTEVHWTKTIDLSRGPTKKGHFPTCYDVIFLEILDIFKVLKNRIKCAYIPVFPVCVCFPLCECVPVCQYL